MDSEKLLNTPVLQSSAKNLLVNQAAFQKVFRARFDEGRSNTGASNFAYSEPKQQFLTDFGTLYTRALKKNNQNYYTAPLLKKSPFLNNTHLTTLLNTLNSGVYDFPFLLAQTSDLIRYT
jgi:hypothetical protein